MARTPAESPKTFISYAREDAEFALKLASDLRKAEANIWLDRFFIPVGADWPQAVEEALNSCSQFLVILSPASVGSLNVMAELNFALEEGKRIFPVLYQECKRPFRIRSSQYADLTADYQTGVATLLKALGVGQEIKPEVVESVAPAETITEHTEHPPKPVPVVEGVAIHGWLRRRLLYGAVLVAFIAGGDYLARKVMVGTGTPAEKGKASDTSGKQQRFSEKEESAETSQTKPTVGRTSSSTERKTTIDTLKPVNPAQNKNGRRGQYKAPGRQESTQPIARLEVNDVVVDCEHLGGTGCELDFRLVNRGTAPASINRVVLTAQIVEWKQMLAGFKPTAKYEGLDLTSLRRPGDTSQLTVSQLLQPHEVDRFTVKAVVKDLGMGEYRRWIAAVSLLTSEGRVEAGKVTLVLPSGQELLPGRWRRLGEYEQTGSPRYSVCLLYEATKPFKSAGTIPIKLQLCDGSGRDLSSSLIAVHVVNSAGFGYVNSDNDFRFDSSLGKSGGYIFNLKATGLATGSYTLHFTVSGDPFVYAAPFQVE